VRFEPATPAPAFVPPFGTPPISVEPPIAIEPPAALVPPVAMEPPVALAPPVAIEPPVALAPPAALEPPADGVPPVEGVPAFEVTPPFGLPLAPLPPDAEHLASPAGAQTEDSGGSSDAQCASKRMLASPALRRSEIDTAMRLLTRQAELVAERP
jgi:hypothetical protein